MGLQRVRHDWVTSLHLQPWPMMDGLWWTVLTKCDSLEKGMANHFSILALRTSWTVWKGKKIGHWNEFPTSVGAQYATGDQWRYNSRKNEEIKPKQNHHPVVDVIGNGSQVQCCKQEYYIGTWNVRSMNQGILEVVKQEMARVKRWHFSNQWPKRD